MTHIGWNEPVAGEIVWCRFPDQIHPRPKPRPALILAVYDDDAPQFAVRVAYDTKFDLRQILDLPYSSEWFSVPPTAPHGQTPKLGTLHPSLVRAVEAAFRAAND